MWYFIYNVVLVLASPALVVFLLAKKRCRRGLLQRLGHLPPGFPASQAGDGGAECHLLWVHAVSLGEVVAAAPLIRELKARNPKRQVIVSTVTETGREAVEQRLAGVAQHCYAPLDFPWVVGRVVDRLRPQAFLFVETELWPNLLKACARRRIPTMMINGRLSTRSFKGYRIIKPFWRRVLGQVTAFLMQSDRDVTRVIELGAPGERVVRTGNLKFDQPLPEKGQGARGMTRQALGLEENEELLVAGSTHRGEEEQLLESYARLRDSRPSLVLMLAPRHVERASEVEAAARAAGFAVVRRSQMESGEPVRTRPGTPRVIVLDTRGELAQVYRHGVLAFIGGTLVPVGGHNLLEPALWSKPVFFGPHTDHCSEVAELLVQSGGGIQVRDHRQLTQEIASRLQAPEALGAMGQAAKRVVVENQGALERTLTIVGNLLLTPISDRPRASPSLGLRLRRLFGPFLRGVVYPYELIVKARAYLYQHGWLQRRKLPCRVVSVGNLTVGGSGKTPLVIFLVGWLLTRGERVAVLSRGYRRQGKEPFLLVSDGQSILANPREAGDEPFLVAQRCPGAVVAVGADRYSLGKWVLERFPLDYVLLDDGFQHLALERDTDLLLVDASNPAGLDALFPVGRLREPLSAARRASALVLTRVNGRTCREDLPVELFASCYPQEDPILVRFRAEALVDVVTGTLHEIGSLAGRTAVVFSGIANASSFRALLAHQELRILGERVFPDHHRYSAGDIQEVRSLARETGSEWILTTEKDASKVSPFVESQDRVFAVRLATEILKGRERLERLIVGRAAPRDAAAS